MAPQSAQGVVQLNVYGATLSDMLHKGVNIPRLLGKFGYDDCVVFDVPRRKQSSTGDLFDRSFDDSEEILGQNNDQMKDKFYEEGNGVVGNPLNSLLNCSLNTIPNGSPRIWHDMDESDEDFFFPFGGEVVFSQTMQTKATLPRLLMRTMEETLPKSQSLLVKEQMPIQFLPICPIPWSPLEAPSQTV